MSHFKVLTILILSLFLTGCSTVAVTPGSIDDYKNLKTIDYLTGVGLNEYENSSFIHKFGATNLDTTSHIISISEEYKTPLLPVSLEFVSDDIGDNFTGLGAREITIRGINSSWMEQTVTIQTNGLTPVQLPIQFLRVHRWWVSSSGTYAATGTTSYIGNLQLRETGSGALWTTIKNTPITTGQSQIGAYTVEKGKTAYLLSKSVFTDSTKTADFYFFFRDQADDVTSPFNGTRRIIEREVGVTGGHNVEFLIPKFVCLGPCDIGMFGSVTSGDAEASIEFELLLIDN